MGQTLRAVLPAIIAAALLAGRTAPAQAAGSGPTLPSTFNSTIGNALLCLDAIDPAFFYDYMLRNFGPPYQHQGSAWWFRTPKAKLWNVPVTAIMVSDNNASLFFIAAQTGVSTVQLAQAIRNSAGPVFQPGGGGPTPLLVSPAGSIIAWQQDQSKIYCAKDRRLFNVR